jgi:hypothetical protein
MINIELPASVTISTPFGNMTFGVDADSQLLYTYFKIFGDTVNARVASPSNKTIVITLPTPIPTNYTQDTPFGKMTFQYKASTIMALQMLTQLAQGIDQVWNG